MKKNNLVQSSRGPTGGYSLTRSPEEIKLSSIIGAVDEKVKTVGCKKESNCIKRFTQFLEILNSGDYTNTHEFLGIADRYLFKLSCENKILQLSGKLLGVIDKNNKILGIDELLSESYYTFDKQCIGIYLPADEILKRIKYQWFPRLSHATTLKS